MEVDISKVRTQRQDCGPFWMGFCYDILQFEQTQKVNKFESVQCICCEDENVSTRKMKICKNESKMISELFRLNVIKGRNPLQKKCIFRKSNL